MVGLSIGLLVVAVAMGALVASRGISGTVSDASSIQQQAAYILRTIGAQVRQAGSLYVEATETEVVLIKRKIAVLEADEDHPERIFTIGYSADPSHPSTDVGRDCLGSGGGTANAPISSQFNFDPTTHTLRCIGTAGGTPQPLASNVADFQVRYLTQVSGGDDPKMQYSSTPPTDISQAVGIEVCFTLFGHERVDMPTGTTYNSCNYNAAGEPQPVDMTALTGNRSRRMHLTFRNVFQLRGQNKYEVL